MSRLWPTAKRSRNDTKSSVAAEDFRIRADITFS